MDQTLYAAMVYTLIGAAVFGGMSTAPGPQPAPLSAAALPAPFGFDWSGVRGLLAVAVLWPLVGLLLVVGWIVLFWKKE